MNENVNENMNENMNEPTRIELSMSETNKSSKRVCNSVTYILYVNVLYVTNIVPH